MSKARKAFFGSLFVSVSLALSAGSSLSQDIEASITVFGDTSKVKVAGRNPRSVNGGNLKSLSFLRSSIGAGNLGTRISELTLFDSEGRPVPYNRISPTEFATSADFFRWSYLVDIAPLANMRAAAHVSWLNDGSGLLMLDDLLPQFSGPTALSALMAVEAPQGWSLHTSEKRSADDRIAVENIEKAVIALGKELRETKLNFGNSDLRLSISGEWHFSDAEAAAVADEVYRHNLRLFGAGPADQLQFVIMRFPMPGAQPGAWEAETRGTTVVLISADMPFKGQSLQRLREQWRHEIFHLWLPNGVRLAGNYAWFFEGFALYNALKSGVLLNQIRFEDLLDTILRASGIEKGLGQRSSLIEASSNRFAGAETQVYARGLLAAFWCDVLLLQSSKGKTSVDTLLRAIFSSHRPPAKPVEANPAILELMSGYPSLKPVVGNYINGQEKVDLQGLMDIAGIEERSEAGRPTLQVKAKLNGGQKAILDKLGYNSWRKLAPRK